MKKQENSFRAKWSEPLERYGYTQVSNIFLKLYSSLDIKSYEAMFIIHCFEYKWSVHDPYPSLSTIGAKMGKDRDTVQRYARSLELKGFIKRKFHNGVPSRIDLKPLIELLEHLAPHSKMNKGNIQICAKGYLKMHNKEEPLIKNL